MMGQEPKIVAVVCCEAVQKGGDLVLLPDLAGGADETVWVRSGAKHQRVTRPPCKVRTQRDDCGFGSAREQQIKERDVAGLPRWQTSGHGLGGRKGRSRGHDVTF